MYVSVRGRACESGRGGAQTARPCLIPGVSLHRADQNGNRDAHVLPGRSLTPTSSSSLRLYNPPRPARSLHSHLHPTTFHESHSSPPSHEYPPPTIMGAIFSAIGSAINAIVSAIAQVIMIIVSVIVTILVTIFDVIFDILCCNCFGGRTRRTGTHSYRFGSRGGGGTY
ncbi:hypothetical protein C2E23DRAFT_177367 [Lenzites betulinus]|nr:hypothetical protein C2E23DRAFT_177367 [Lenzites betulinus]